MKLFLSIIGSSLLAFSAPALAGWDFKLVENLATKEKRGIATVKAVGQNDSLTLKCDNRGKVYLEWFSTSFSEPRRNVEIFYSIDKKPRAKIFALYRKSYASIINHPHAGDGEFKKLVRALMHSSKLQMQSASIRRGAAFNVTGFTDALTRVAKTCNDSEWSGG